MVNTRPISFPVGLKFALIVFLLIVMQNIFLTLIESQRVRSNLVQEKELDLNVSMASMQQTLTFLIRQGHMHEVQQIVTSLGSDPRFRAVFLIDADNIVMASTRVDAIGTNIYNQLTPNASQNLEGMMPVLKHEFRTRIWQGVSGKSIYAAVPIALGRTSETIFQPDRIGVLLVWQDKEWIEDAVTQLLYASLIQMTVVTLFIALSFFVIFHLFINRRLRRIYDAVNRYEPDEKFVALDLPGSDELSELAHAFNGMAQQVTRQHDELLVVNERLHKTQEIAHIGSWELDLVNNKLIWSDEVYRIFGYEPQKFPATYEAFLDAVHPDDRDRVNIAYSSSVYQGRRGYEIEHRVVQKSSGAIRYVYERCEHVRDEGGNIILSRGMVQDITPRKQIEFALQQSEVHFRNIIHASPVPMALNDERGNILYLNPAFVQSFGYDLNDIPTSDAWWHKAYPDEQYRQWVKSEWKNKVEKAEKSGKPIEPIEVQVQCKNGGHRTVSIQAAPLQEDFNGTTIGILFDITERVLAQSQMQESDRRLRLATEASGIGIWEWNLRTNRVRWDAQMFRIYGIPPTVDGFVDYADWSTSVLPDELAKQETILNEATRTSGRSNREFHIRRRNDRMLRTIRAMEIVRPGQDGQAEWLVGTNMDITDRENAENELRKQQEEQQYILNSMIDAVITIDEHGTVLTYNTAAEVMFGYMANDVIGNNVKMLMPDDTAAHHDDYLRAYLNGGAPKVIGVGREVMARRSSGELFPMRLSVADLPRTADNRRRFVGTCHDMTYEKQRNEILRRSQKMDALGKLTGGVAHDFNNMLGVILGYSELLQLSLVNDPKLKKYISEIHQAGERARKLTSKLLAFSRPTLGDIGVVNMNQLLQDEQHMLEKALTARIQLVLDLGENLWPVELDKSALEDAILNMSINAMHAMPDGGKLTIVTENVKLSDEDAGLLQLQSGDHAAMAIIDTGVGMDEDTRQKIFDPFFTTKGEKGTGLGMSQVYGFVKQSKGAIAVQSIPGSGTRITLYFPRCTGVVTTQDNIRNGMNGNHSGRGTILVVDDESALTDLAKEILEGHGYRVLTAGQARTAMDILQVEKVDLVLSDIVMPGMDGYQLADHIRKHYPQIRIQLASGFTDERDPGMHADLHQKRLYKPYSVSALLKAVKALLD